MPVTRPARPIASFRRNLPLTGRLREALYVNFKPARFRRGVREPASIWGELRLYVSKISRFEESNGFPGR